MFAGPACGLCSCGSALNVVSIVALLCSVYERAFRNLRQQQPDAKEEAVMLLEAWRAFEAETFSAEARQVSSHHVMLHILGVFKL